MDQAAAEVVAPGVSGALTILEQMVRQLPDHPTGGYEWEWECQYRTLRENPEGWPDCTWDNPEHSDDLISRRRVLELIAELSDADEEHGSGNA